MSNEIDLKKAKEELLLGRPIFIFDEEGRESETDIFFYAELVTSENLHYHRLDTRQCSQDKLCLFQC